MLHSSFGKVFLIVAFGVRYLSVANAGERRVDPTFLHRNLANIVEKKSDLSTDTCHYKPIFGEGDSDTSVVIGVARFGDALVDPNGACATMQYHDEDQMYFVLEGNGS